MVTVNLFGCGAVGSHAAWHIAHLVPKVRFTLWDFDRVGEENLGTTIYSKLHVGAFKANALSQILWYHGVGSAVPFTRRVTSKVVFERTEYALDCFDNARSRGLIRGRNVLHVGVSETPSGHVEWDSGWTPPPIIDRDNPICTHQLGAFILAQTGLTAARILATEVLDGQRREAYISRDGQVQIT